MTEYPDPEQLRAFADDPMPFHSLTATDFEMDTNGHLVATVDDTEYVYRQSSLLVELEEDEWTPVGTMSRLPNVMIDHDYCWKRADNVEVREGYVSATGLTKRVKYQELLDEPVQFDAKWILWTITVKNRENR